MTTQDKDQQLIPMLASLLGAGIGEGGAAAADSEAADCCKRKKFRSLIGDNHDMLLSFSCPALSLVHDDHLNFNHENANEAEKSAFELLSRSMGFEASATEKSALAELADVSNVLLSNVSESFALLVDSRLRAHADFLSRHGRMTAKRNFTGTSSFDLLDQKLQTLLELGNRVSASRVETKVVVDAGLTDQAKEDICCESEIMFQVAMKLFVDSLDGGLNSSMAVQFESKGSLSVSRETGHFKLDLKIDTKELLGQMKQQASQVVAQVVTLTNSHFVIPEPTFHRDDNYLVMPPPPAPGRLKENDASCGSSSSEKSMALVSPDVSAAFQVREVPLLVLNGDDAYDGDSSETSDLSPDQCEDILDDVFGGIDLAVFSAGYDAYSDRPAKKSRTCE